MVKNSFLSAIVAVVVSLAVMLWGAGKPGITSVAPQFGGLEHNSRENFSGGLLTSAMGGDVTAYTSGSVTFTAKTICNSAVITQNNIGAPASAQTNTLPSASSLIANCLPSKGDSRVVRFENIAGAGEVFTFQLGSGIDIFVASGSAVGAGKGDGPKLWPEAAALVRFTNMNGSSVSADFIEMINGD